MRAAFADGEAEAVFHRDQGDQLDFELQVVARHHHLGAFRQRHGAVTSVVRSRTADGSSRRTACGGRLLPGQDVDLALELGVRLDRTRLAENLATRRLRSMPRGTAPMLSPASPRSAACGTSRRPCRSSSWCRGCPRSPVRRHVHHAAFDATGHHGAAARDREHVFDRHQEGLIGGARRLRDVLVDRGHQFLDLVFADVRITAFERGKRRTRDDRNVVAGVVVGRRSSRTSISTSSSSSSSSTWSTLFRNTTMAGMPT